MANTETKTAAPTANAVKAFASAKRSRLVFFALNLALVLPFLIQHYSAWGLGGALAVLLLSFYLLVLKPQTAAPAARDIPLQLFLNICLYLAVSYPSLLACFQIENLGLLFQNLNGKCGILLLAGLAVSIFVPKLWHLLWLRFAGKMIVGISVLMMIWADGNMIEPGFQSNAGTFLVFYLLFSLFWLMFCIISFLVDPFVYTRNCWLTNFLLLIFVLFCTTEHDMAQHFIPQARAYLLSMPTASLAWWKVCLSVAVLAGGAIVTFDDLHNTMGADALVLCFAASALVILRVLMANYFSFNWVVFLAFLAGCVGCISNELQREKTLRLKAMNYAAVQLLAILVSIWLLKAGLWINLVIAAAYTLIFYVTAEKRNNEKYRLLHWLTVLSAPVVSAIAYIWRARFSLDTVILLALVYALFAGVMIVLHWPHPNKLIVPRGYKVAVCTMLTLLCLIAMSRFGAKVTIALDSGTAVVEITARGKKNRIESAEYRWSTITGETLDTARIVGGRSSLPASGDVLTVTATDCHGVVTTKTAWYPDRLLFR